MAGRAPTVSVRVWELPAESVTIPVVREKVRPAPVAVTSTVPLKPLRLVSVMMEFVVAPAFRSKVDCDVEMSMSGGGGMAVTLSVTCIVCEVEPPTATTLTS